MEIFENDRQEGVCKMLVTSLFRRYSVVGPQITNYNNLCLFVNYLHWQVIAPDISRLNLLLHLKAISS